MSNTTAVLSPRLPVAPRGAQLVGYAYDLITRAVQRVQDARARRAALAQLEAVREHARRIERFDPGMAADLRAAADRHVGIDAR